MSKAAVTLEVSHCPATPEDAFAVSNYSHHRLQFSLCFSQVGTILVFWEGGFWILNEKYSPNSFSFTKPEISWKEYISLSIPKVLFLQLDRIIQSLQQFLQWRKNRKQHVIQLMIWLLLLWMHVFYFSFCGNDNNINDKAMKKWKFNLKKRFKKIYIFFSSHFYFSELVLSSYHYICTFLYI